VLTSSSYTVGIAPRSVKSNVLSFFPTLPNPANGIGVEDRVTAKSGTALNLALGSQQTVNVIPMMKGQKGAVHQMSCFHRMLFAPASG